jgi:tubulin--tyrosine ligase-like protein 12
MSEQATYSIMFPLSDLDENDEVTRDFVEGSGADEISRSALLHPWSEEFSQEFLASVDLEQVEPSPDYFSVSLTSNNSVDR